jgi:hypothetical protein
MYQKEYDYVKELLDKKLTEYFVRVYEKEYNHINHYMINFKKEWIKESILDLNVRNNKRLKEVEDCIKRLLDYSKEKKNEGG